MAVRGPVFRSSLLASAFLALLLAGCVVDPRDDREIVFTTVGSSFAPLVIVEGTAEIQWSFSDGSTSDSAEPSVDFVTADRREQRLRVTPWSAVKAIDIGYDGQDGGTLDFDVYVKADQSVAAIANLDLVASSLEVWCSSYNQIESLDFSGFVELRTIECFQSQLLRSIDLSSCPSLARACLEDCDLESLDLTGCPNLEDLRAAANDFPAVVFADAMPAIWHICIRGNPQMTAQDLFASSDRFPVLRELYIWDDNQAGTLRVATTGGNDVEIFAYANGYTFADFRGALQNESADAFVELMNNQLTGINIDECDQILYLNLRDNQLGADKVTYLLVTLDALGRNDGFVYLDGSGNAAPLPEAAAAISNLLAKGWEVWVN